MKFRFLTRKCRPGLPCSGGSFHTHHLVFMWPPRWLRSDDGE